MQGKLRFSLFIGASVGADTENRWAQNDMIDRRWPYQTGKDIGAMPAVMHGKVDQTILTGGIAYGKETVDAISEMVGWIAPITVYPGEDELLALAQGALRVLKGEEPALEYRRPRPDDNN